MCAHGRPTRREQRHRLRGRDTKPAACGRGAAAQRAFCSRPSHAHPPAIRAGRRQPAHRRPQASTGASAQTGTRRSLILAKISNVIRLALHAARTGVFHLLFFQFLACSTAPSHLAPRDSRLAFLRVASTRRSVLHSYPLFTGDLGHAQWKRRLISSEGYQCPIVLLLYNDRFSIFWFRFSSIYLVAQRPPKSAQVKLHSSAEAGGWIVLERQESHASLALQSSIPSDDRSRGCHHYHPTQRALAEQT